MRCAAARLSAWLSIRSGLNSSERMGSSGRPGAFAPGSTKLRTRFVNSMRILHDGDFIAGRRPSIPLGGLAADMAPRHTRFHRRRLLPSKQPCRRIVDGDEQPRSTVLLRNAFAPADLTGANVILAFPPGRQSGSAGDASPRESYSRRRL